MEIKSKEGRHFAIFEIDRDTALDYSKKIDTHKFNITCIDKRPKSNSQVKFFWAMLDEFVYMLLGEKVPKQELEKVKDGLYQEFREDTTLQDDPLHSTEFSLSESDVSGCRFFLNWLIKLYADRYGYVPKNVLLQDEFNEAYAYATLVSNSCIICDKQAVPVKKGRGYASLCAEHKDLTAKELQNNFHVSLIKMADSTIEFLKEQ